MPGAQPAGPGQLEPRDDLLHGLEAAHDLQVHRARVGALLQLLAAPLERCQRVAELVEAGTFHLGAAPRFQGISAHGRNANEGDSRQMLEGLCSTTTR